MERKPTMSQQQDILHIANLKATLARVDDCITEQTRTCADVDADTTDEDITNMVDILRQLMVQRRNTMVYLDVAES
jgi:hypothetical protein